MKTNDNFSNYYFYIDECGDHQLEKFNPNFPIFTLCGFLVPGQNIDSLEATVNRFKRKYFNDESVIIHSRDIRKQEKEYSILQDSELKKQFYEDINKCLDWVDLISVIKKIT